MPDVRYPIYIPSKSRWQKARCLTMRVLDKHDVPYRVVVEPQEAEHYIESFGEGKILQLPFSNLGLGSIPARNWIREHAEGEGHARHWQLDDNIRVFRRLDRGMRIPCDPALALRVCEDFTERYANVGVSGLNYQMFVPNNTRVEFYWNVHVYSCTLVNHKMEARWRGRYNEDTDLCLQALSTGWCTILLNAFMADKMPTGIIPGGNAATIYDAPRRDGGSEVRESATEDGRLKMARELERRWPGVVKVERRYGRAQHVIDWKAFKKRHGGQLGLLEDEATLEWDPPELQLLPREQWPEVNYGLSLTAVVEPKAERYRKLLAEHAATPPEAARDEGGVTHG